MKAGTYYVGDLCYMISDWDSVCDVIIKDARVLSGEFKTTKGIPFANYGTAHGDGSYYAEGTYSYLGVDSGSIGCVELSLVGGDEDRARRMGTVVEFTNDFETSESEGTIRFGHISIKTADTTTPCYHCGSYYEEYELIDGYCNNCQDHDDED